MMKELGLIGKNIGYSFSRDYFSEKFEKLGVQEVVSYQNFDLQDISEVEQQVFSLENWAGANVTIPYKQQIIPFLDELSDEAREIGAVNTIVLREGKKIGYNTDAFGFEMTLKKHLTSLQKERKAIVLGDGGASKAVQYVLKKNEIPFLVVSRKSELNFTNLTKEMVSRHHIIVQCTPVGTFPNIFEHLPFPYFSIGESHLVIDLIYNPRETLFLLSCRLLGATTVNGQEMLHAQAEKSWELWSETMNLKN